jgi:mRNA interferase MazF
MDERRQGQIWVADLPQPFGRRPVLILTRSSAISVLHNVTIATITTSIRDIDTEVLIGPSDGIDKKCAITLDNIHTIGTQYLEKFVAELSADKMSEVFQGIREAFDMPF